MSQTSLGSIAAGNLVNLMSNDVARFDYVFMFMHHLWIVPIQAGVVLYFLYDSGGVAPIIGLVGVILVITPLQGMF